MDFVDFVVAATGGTRPYPYQERLAAEGLPDVLYAHTGAGKTLAAVLPRLYRRTAHPDTEVPATTSRWLVVVLPQRALVEQTVRTVLGWRSYGLSAAVAETLLMTHWKIRRLLDGGLRLQTACDLDLIGEIRARRGEPLPDAETLTARLVESLAAGRDAFGAGAPLTVERTGKKTSKD